MVYRNVLQGGSFFKKEDNCPCTERYLIQKDDELLPKETKNITVTLLIFPNHSQYELAGSVATVRPKTFHCLHNPKPMGGSSSVIAVYL